MEKQARTKTPPSNPEDGNLSAKTCVVVPTTGGLVWVRGLKKRPRLKSSYAIMDGDFRPLKLSKDYHYFVAGPLTQVHDPAQIFELSLSDNIDSGRSWEFPTLLAHLLEKQDSLAFPDPATLEKSGDPGFDLVWATGMLDPDLAPVAADYKLTRKLDLSRPLFENCVKHGRAIRILLCADLPAKERALFRQAAKEFGADYHEISTLDELTKVPGLANAPQKTRSAKAADEESVSASSSSILSRAATNNSWLPYGAAAAAASALVLWAGLSIFGPGPSNTLTDPESGDLNGTPEFAIERLTARDQMDCRKHVMMAQRFETATLQPGKKSGFSLKGQKGLCGLRFRNTGSAPFRLQLSEPLEGYAIVGNSSLFLGRELRAGKYTDLYLSRLPDELRAQLTVTPEGGVKSRFTIEFTRSAPDG